MTTYSAIAASQIDADSFIDTTLATQWTNNVLAMFEGAAGAPVLANSYITTAMFGSGVVDQSAMASSSVGQGQLKTALQQTSGTVAANPSVGNVAFTGGAYTLGWAYAGNSSIFVSFYSAGTYTWGIGWRNYTFGSSSTYYFEARYIQASPPYDLGDGQIPLFVFAVIDNTTKAIESISAAPEAPWHYNGPTIITPDYYDDKGDGYILTPDMSAYGQTLAQAKAAGGAAVHDYLQARQQAQKSPVLVDQAIKNADMNVLPHPFLDDDLTGKTVVLLDPVSTVMEDLLLLQEQGEKVTDIVRDYLTIGNNALNRQGPNRVMPVSVAWK